MTPPTLISVINRSSRLSDADAERASMIVSRQLAEHVAPVYGLVPALEFVRSGGTPSPGGCPCVITDVPDEDGVLGYHYEDDRGIPSIKVFMNPILDNGGTALVGGLSLSAVLSHEALELTEDAPANRWADGPKGLDYAVEFCHPVQADVYEIDGVSVANFVLQAFFDPRAEAGSRLDYLGRLSRPFTMTPGGYQITRSEPGRVSNIYGAASGSPTVEGASERIPLGTGLHLHIGAEMPEWRRTGLAWKARRKRGGRVVL